LRSIPRTNPTTALLGPSAADSGVATDPGCTIEVASAPAQFAAEFVRRRGLVRRLTDARGAQLALIAAPPGYGKSSLLAELAESDDRPCVWLGLRMAESPEDEVASLNGAIAVVTVSDLGVLVVLDDADLVPPKLLRSVTEAILAAAPEGSMLVLASRNELELPTGRLRAHRALVELRTSDLGMTQAEASRLLRQAGLELDDDSVHALVDQTGGWPAALYLAALSARECSDAPAGVAGFRGDDHLLSEYVRDEVLAALPSKLLTFATRSSVLDVLSGPACDALLKETDSALKLRRLARATQLLEPVDRAHSQYRWHPLLRDSLRAELRLRDPARERRLEQRASKWYAAQGDIDRAIDHGCASRAGKQTGALLWDNIVTYLTHGSNDRVAQWIGRFSREQIASDAPLAMCAAHSSLALGKLDDAKQWAACASALAQNAELESEDSMAGAFAVIDATAARGGAIGMRAIAERGFEREPAASRWRPHCRLLSGVAAYLGGDVEAAVAELTDAHDLGGAAVPTVTALALAELGMIAIEQQNWQLATEHGDVAAAIIDAGDLDDEPTMALAFAVCAAARAHEGRVDEAKRDLRRGVELLTALGDYAAWYCAQTTILLAHASLWLADVVGARTLLAQASRLARRIPDAVTFGHWFDDAWSYLDTLAETSLAGPSSLTIAELRILRFLPSHRSFREIADQLGVSSNTVKTQAHAVYRKLGAASRSEAVRRAIDAGLLGQ
jgi:LuxR family maltose regulon positive regulatory protein